MATPVYADTLYRTSFENPPFVAGTPLVGQDDWTAPPPPPGSPLSSNAAVITNAAAKSGRQSVEVHGADLISFPAALAPYDAVGSYRKPLLDQDGLPNGYTVSGNKRLARVDADLLLGTNQPKTPGEFFSLTIAARSGNGETLGEVGLSSEGIVEAFPFNATPGDLTGRFTKPIRFNKWYHITMLLDFAHRTTSYFIDDHFLGAVQAASTSNVLLRGAMVVYARPGGLGSARSNYTARFDRFRVSVHSAAPEID